MSEEWADELIAHFMSVSHLFEKLAVDLVCYTQVTSRCPVQTPNCSEDWNWFSDKAPIWRRF